MLFRPRPCSRPRFGPSTRRAGLCRGGRNDLCRSGHCPTGPGRAGLRALREARKAPRVLVAMLVVAALFPRTSLAQQSPLEPAVPLAGTELLAAAATADTTPEGGAGENRTSSRIFYGALIAGAALSFHYSVDPDEGGYEDGWNTAAAFPDKAVHALAAWALTTVGTDLGVRPWISAASVCAAGTAFELSQGYVSKLDIAADCAGAAGAALWRTWRDRANAARER